MNYETIQLLVTRNLGNRTDIAPYRDHWINSTYMDLVTTGKFPEVKHFAPIPVPELDGSSPLVTAKSDFDYDVPTDFLFPISMYNETSGYGLKLKDVRWYDRKRSTTEGRPYYYVIYAKQILLNSTPDAVYNLALRYRKKLVLPVLINPEDIPVVGEEWHEGIVLGATYRGARSLNFPNAETWLNDWRNFIAGHSEQTTEEEEDADIGLNFVW